MTGPFRMSISQNAHKRIGEEGHLQMVLEFDFVYAQEEVTYPSRNSQKLKKKKKDDWSEVRRQTSWRKESLVHYYQWWITFKSFSRFHKSSFHLFFRIGSGFARCVSYLLPKPKIKTQQNIKIGLQIFCFKSMTIKTSVVRTLFCKNMTLTLFFLQRISKLTCALISSVCVSL